MRAVFHAALLALAACVPAHAQSTYTWTDITPPKPASGATRIADLAVHPLDGKRLVVAFGDRDFVTRGGLRASDDGGLTWNAPVAEPLSLDLIGRLHAHLGSPGVLFLQEDGSRNNGRAGRTYRSEDFGVTWTLIHDDPPTVNEFAVSPFASDPLDTNHIFATRRSPMGCGRMGCSTPGDTTVVQSRDGGRTWSAPGAGLSQSIIWDTGFSDFSIRDNATGPVPAAPARMFIGVSRGTGYLTLATRDSGASWNSAGPYFWIVPDPTHANVLYAQTAPVYVDGAKLLRTDDEGATWRSILQLHTVYPYSLDWSRLTVDPVRSRNLWLAGVETGVFHSSDAGETWTNVGFPATVIHSSSTGTDFADPGTVASLVVVNSADAGVVYVVQKDRLYRGVPSSRPDPIVVEFQYEGNRYWLTSLDGEALSQDYRMEPGNVRAEPGPVMEYSVAVNV